MPRIFAISLPLNVTVLAKLFWNVSDPRATKMSRSCSVGRPSSVFPCTCQETWTSAPSGSTFVPWISSFPIRFPTLRSRTANGIAARFSSSTDRCSKDGFGTVLTHKNCLFCFYNGTALSPSTLRSSTYQPCPHAFPFHMLLPKPFHMQGSFKSASSCSSLKHKWFIVFLAGWRAMCLIVSRMCLIVKH